MRRWLWKEFRERGWWALCWAAAIFVGTLGACQQTINANGEIWLFPGGGAALLLAVLLGTTAYAAETLPGRALFLFAKPMPWWRPLLGKVLLAAVVIAVAVLLAALCYKLGGPERYRPLLTAEKTLEILLAAEAVLLLPYLIAMACSVVLTGAAGGIITFCAVLVVLLAVVVVGNQYFPVQAAQDANFRAGLKIACTLAAVLAAGVPLMRFGLTLNVHERFRRFTLVFIMVLVVLLTASALVPPPARATAQSYAKRIELSPDGRHALVLAVHFDATGTTERYTRRYSACILRLADQTPVMELANAEGLADNNRYFAWLSPTRLLTVPVTYRYGITVIDLAARRTKAYPLSRNDRFAGASPNGRTVVFRHEYYGTKSPKHSTPRWLFLDLDTGHTVTRELGDLWRHWWEPDGTLAYRDDTGVHRVALPWPGAQ